MEIVRQWEHQRGAVAETITESPNHAHDAGILLGRYLQRGLSVPLYAHSSSISAIHRHKLQAKSLHNPKTYDIRSRIMLEKERERGEGRICRKVEGKDEGIPSDPIDCMHLKALDFDLPKVALIIFAVLKYQAMRKKQKATPRHHDLQNSIVISINVIVFGYQAW